MVFSRCKDLSLKWLSDLGHKFSEHGSCVILPWVISSSPGQCDILTTSLWLANLAHAPYNVWTQNNVLRRCTRSIETLLVCQSAAFIRMSRTGYFPKGSCTTESGDSRLTSKASL